MKALAATVRQHLVNHKGQTMVEYVFLLLLVALVVAAFVPDITVALQDSYARTALAFVH